MAKNANGGTVGEESIKQAEDNTSEEKSAKDQPTGRAISMMIGCNDDGVVCCEPGAEIQALAAWPIEAGSSMTKSLNIRPVDDKIYRQFTAAAGARNLSHGEYLAKLVELHDWLRNQATVDTSGVKTKLDELGLAPVTT